jgi:DNA-binding NarL/FixJ family response regulator
MATLCVSGARHAVAVAPIRVFIADDHALFRKGIVSLVGSEPGFEVVGEATSGPEAVSRALELLPDVVLMDLSMPDGGGLEATRRIKERAPEVHVIMLTASDDGDDLLAAVKSGAQGYLLKKIDPDVLFSTIHGVMRGEPVISPSTAGRLLDELARLSRRRSNQDLSPREAEVLTLVVQGKTNKEIASALAVAENTVKNHLKSILGKLEVENRVQATSLAIRERLVPQPKTGGSA